MASSSPSLPENRRAGLQFSLAGMMFTFVLGLSIGMAYWRCSQVNLSGAMLASFTTWLLIGLCQVVYRRFRRLKESSALSRDRSWGQVARIAVPVWALFLLAMVGVSEIAWRQGLIGSGWPRWLADILFFLAILGAYWQPSPDRRSETRPARIKRMVLALALLLVGFYWAWKIMAGESQIVQLVYTAIRKVEAAQPTSWSGKPFPASRLTLSPTELGDLAGQLTLAAALVAVAAIAAGLMTCFWHSHARFRLLLFALWLASLLAAAGFLFACSKIGPPDLPLLSTPQIFDLAWSAKAMLGVLVLTLVTAAALQYASATLRQEVAAGHAYASFVPLHHHRGVIAFGLFAIVAGIAIDLWQNASDMSPTPMSVSSWLMPNVAWRTALEVGRVHVLSMPQSMIQFAAALILLRCLSRGHRSSLTTQIVWSVEPDRFLALWFVFLLTPLIAAPILVWSCVVAALR